MAAKGMISVVSDDREEVEATVRSLLVDVLGLDSGRVASFNDETELFGALPEFDSMAVATLLTEMEERLGILIEDRGCRGRGSDELRPAGVARRAAVADLTAAVPTCQLSECGCFCNKTVILVASKRARH